MQNIMQIVTSHGSDLQLTGGGRLARKRKKKVDFETSSPPLAHIFMRT